MELGRMIVARGVTPGPLEDGCRRHWPKSHQAGDGVSSWAQRDHLQVPRPSPACPGLCWLQRVLWRAGVEGEEEKGSCQLPTLACWFPSMMPAAASHHTACSLACAHHTASATLAASLALW